jgi:hypothetical protein
MYLDTVAEDMHNKLFTESFLNRQKLWSDDEVRMMFVKFQNVIISDCIKRPAAVNLGERKLL